MTYTQEEIKLLITGGENTSVEFKAADVKADALAREVIIIVGG